MQQRPTTEIQEPYCPTIWAPTAMWSILSTLHGMRRGIRTRRELKRIARLDDRLLSDIGVTRGDVNSALSARWNEDGVRRLCELREERRRARHNRHQ